LAPYATHRTKIARNDTEKGKWKEGKKSEGEGREVETGFGVRAGTEMLEIGLVWHLVPYFYVARSVASGINQPAGAQVCIRVG